MKAVVFHGVGDVRLDTVPEPKLKERTNAIVQLTASAICGTDLHFANMGNCNHRTYIPKLVAKVASGTTDPTVMPSQVEPMRGAIKAYKQFDRRRPGRSRSS